MNIAVITGASSGLGKVFYEKVMERYSELDEVWLIKIIPSAIVAKFTSVEGSVLKK